eukprot:5977078-Prymnesium_polylepis.1
MGNASVYSVWEFLKLDIRGCLARYVSSPRAFHGLHRCSWPRQLHLSREPVGAPGDAGVGWRSPASACHSRVSACWACSACSVELTGTLEAVLLDTGEQPSRRTSPAASATSNRCYLTSVMTPVTGGDASASKFGAVPAAWKAA